MEWDDEEELRDAVHSLLDVYQTLSTKFPESMTPEDEEAVRTLAEAVMRTEELDMIEAERQRALVRLKERKTRGSEDDREEEDVVIPFPFVLSDRLPECFSGNCRCTTDEESSVLDSSCGEECEKSAEKRKTSRTSMKWINQSKGSRRRRRSCSPAPFMRHSRHLVFRVAVPNLDKHAHDRDGL